MWEIQLFNYSDLSPFFFQELPEEGSAAERNPHLAAQLRGIPQTAQLAVVEAVHKGQATAPGNKSGEL